MESNKAPRKRNWSQRTLAGELAREPLIYPGEERVLAALEAAQVTGEMREMTGNLVADIEAREATLRDALEDLLALFKRIGPSPYGAVEQAGRLLKTFQPDQCVGRMGTARSADLGAVGAIRCIADRRVEGAHLVLVDGKTLREVGAFCGWSFQSVDDWVRQAWAARERYREARAAEAKTTVSRGWQRVTLVASAATVRRGRAELEQAGPAPATSVRRAKKASA
jgi:hypothetical protein